jgi:NAD(P)-dependent dehydrogenase (short-subunit alcohol dehydrogenase family)
MAQGTERRTAFVTGASYGVGAATALALARDGYQIAIAATAVDNLAQTVRSLETVGAEPLALALDLRSQDSIEKAVSDVVANFGPIDVLVNNAGVNYRGPAVDITRAEWDEVMNTNVTGTYFLTVEVVRHLLARHRPGCVVNIVSVQGLIGTRGRTTYGISKASIIHMTRTLAVEWAEQAVRVNAVAPGRIDTPSPSRQATRANPEYMKAMIDRIPMHRLTTSEEVAGAACYLAGPHAASLTGQVLTLDGGLTAA